VGLCFNTETNSFAEPALPLLVHNLKDKVGDVRLGAVQALGMFTQHQCQRGLPEPDLLIPPLMEMLQDKYSYARMYAINALDCSCFADKLKPRLPAIQKLLSDPDAGIRQSTSNLLQTLKDSPVTNATLTVFPAATFSVQGNGTNPLSYQWLFNSNGGAATNPLGDHLTLDSTNAAPK
jgi:HEAT repeat protein